MTGICVSGNMKNARSAKFQLPNFSNLMILSEEHAKLNIKEQCDLTYKQKVMAVETVRFVKQFAFWSFLIVQTHNSRIVHVMIIA